MVLELLDEDDEEYIYLCGRLLPEDLLCSGHHYDDVEKDRRRRRSVVDGTTPMRQMMQMVVDKKLARPHLTRKKYTCILRHRKYKKHYHTCNKGCQYLL